MKTVSLGEIGKLVGCVPGSGDSLKRISGIATLNEAGDTGARFCECVSQARESYDLLLAQLISAEPTTAQYARGLADSMGNHLSELERLLEPAESRLH